MLRVAEGNREAFTELYRTEKDKVYAFALSLLKNAHDAEDVLHDCFVTVWMKADTYSPSGKPMAWIMTVARNLCYDKLRSRGKLADLPDEEWDGLFSTDGGLPTEDRLVLRTCLRQLTKEENEILFLHAVAGMKHHEIARLLYKPLATVLSKYNRTLAKLRQMLSEEEQT